MLDYTIVAAKQDHVAMIAATMREADRREVWASGRHTPYEALTVSLKMSRQAWTGILAGRPVLMWGVARAGCVLSPVGRPWLLSSDVIENVAKREFIRRSREFVKIMRAEFPILENYVHAENRLSIRWLKWCGFTMDEIPVSVGGEDFYRFFWRNPNV